MVGQGVNGKIILKYILKRLGGRDWFLWLRIGPSGWAGRCKYVGAVFGPIKRGGGPPSGWASCNLP